MGFNIQHDLTMKHILRLQCLVNSQVSRFGRRKGDSAEFFSAAKLEMQQRWGFRQTEPKQHRIQPTKRGTQPGHVRPEVGVGTGSIKKLGMEDTTHVWD